MAIPGYLQQYNMTYDESLYYDYVGYMVGIVADTHAETVAVIEDIRQNLIQNRAPSLLLPNGHVDVWKIKSPTIQDILAKNIVIVDYGEQTGSVMSGFIDGAFHVFFNEAADDYFIQMSMPIPQQLLPPELYVSNMVGLDAVVHDFGAETLDAVTFCSTFVTKWGETGPSNSIVLYPTGFVGDGNTEGMWSATLEVNGDRIPAFATAVRYYRWFETTFRRILEVDI